jgi:DsbC/DsbD-like thiol-disulfide interchange protein
MKKIVLIVFCAFLSLGASAQLVKTITWSYYGKKINQTEAILYIKAKLDKGWHVYAQNIKSEPMRLKFNYTSSKDFALIGKTTQPKPILKYDKVVQMQLAYFENEVVFTQKIKLNKLLTTVRAKVEFMVCNETSCLPADELLLNIPVKP